MPGPTRMQCGRYSSALGFRRLAMLLAVLAALCVPQSFAPGLAESQSTSQSTGKWRVVGSRDYVFRGLIKRLDLSKAKSFVRGLKVRTSGRRMTFSGLRVIYDDGQQQRVRRRIRLKDGEESTEIAVPADGRFVKEIVLIPDRSAPRRGRIRVEILGLQSDEDATRARGGTTKTTQEVTQTKEPEAEEAKAEKTAAEPAGTEDQKPAAEQAKQIKRVDEASSTPPQKLAFEKKVAALARPALEKPVPDKSQVVKPEVVLGEPTAGGGLFVGSLQLPPGDALSKLALERQVAQFRRIAIRTNGTGAFIETVTINYDNGTRSLENFGVRLFRNTMSRWISVVPDRFIKSIEIRQRPGSGPGSGNRRLRSTLELYGKVANKWLLPTSQAGKLNDGWILLSAQRGRDLRRNDGKLAVARNRGGFRKLRLVARDRQLQKSALVVRFSGAVKTKETARLQIKQTTGENGVELPSQAPISGLRLALGRRALERVAGGARVDVWVKF